MLFRFSFAPAVFGQLQLLQADPAFKGKIGETYKQLSGKVTISTRFKPDGALAGSGTLELMVNQKLVGQGEITRSAFRHGLEPFEIGRDSITPVGPHYRGKGEFPFNGKIEKLVFSLTK